MPDLEVVAENARILIVDDEPDVLRASTHLLREAGYEVIAANTGMDGLRLAGETKPDLIVLDEVLPDMDGLQVCRCIKADAELAHILVILRSATWLDPDSQAWALDVGADEYILGVKSDQELLARVRAMLRIKRAEDALRESELRYRSIVEQSLDGIRLIDEKGTIIEWNGKCEEIMGLKRTEALGVTIWEVLHQLMPDDRKSPEAYERFKSGTLEFLSTGRTAWQSESRVYKIQRPDGTPRFVEERVFPITTDGAILGCGIVRDVTERVRAEEALVASNQLLEMILDHTHILVALLDAQFNFVRVNRAYAEADERHPTFFPGKNHFDLYHDSENHGIFERVVETGEAHFTYAKPFEYAEHPERGVSYWDWGLVPIKNSDGTVSGLILTLLNVTERVLAQEALQRNEERYAMAQQAANIGSWDWNIQTGDLHWSDQIEPMFGFGHDEFGRTYEAFLDCVHPEDRQHVVDAVNACIEEDDDYAIDHRIVWPDGTIRWVAETGDVTRNEDGEATRMLGVVLDVTERKQAEDELRKLSRVVEQNPSIVVITDTKGDIEYVNPKFTQITGYATEEALGKNPRLLKSGKHGLEFYQELWNTILAGQEWRGEFVNKKKNGDLYWEQATIAPLRNAEGKTTRFVKLAEDITERVRAEMALRASEERYRRLLELSFDGIGIHSEGKIEFINSTGAKLLGADDPEQLIGKPVMDFLHPDYHKVVQRRQMRIEEAQTAPLDEEIFIRIDGSHLNVEVTGIGTDFRGKPAVQVVFRDISERKTAEHALRAAKDAADVARREEEERRQEAEQRRLIAESLADVLAALNSEQSLDEVLDLIAIQTRQLLSTEAVAIFSHNDLREAPTIHAAQGLSADYILEAGLPLGYEALKQAMESSQPVTVSDTVTRGGPAKETERLAPPPFWAEPYRAWLAVPIVVRDTIYGAMLLYYAEPRPFSEDEVELAVMIGNQVALAVENDRLRAKSEEAARAAERNRLARELHDAVTQVLFSANLIAETTPRIWEKDPEKGQLGLEELRRLIQGALAEMRTMLLELRPAALKEQRLEVLIRQLTNGLMARTRMPVATTVVGDCELPTEVKLALYRITQEALNNVVKHAQASQAKVYLDCQPGQVVLRVSDDGCGFAPEGIESHKLGVGIMRERAKAVDARFTLDSQPDRGTEITVTWEETEPDQG